MRIIVYVMGVTLFGVALGAAIAHGQIGLDTTTGGIASQGAIPTQSGPVSGESAVADENALAPIGATGANNSREASVGGSARQDMQVQEQNEAASKQDARAGAAATSNTWRYARANGHWWYWMPNNRWAFHYNGGWIPYDASVYGQYYPTPANTPNPASIKLPNSDPRYQSGYRGGPPAGSPAILGGGAVGVGPGVGGKMNGAGAIVNGGPGVPSGMNRARDDAMGPGSQKPVGSNLTPGAGAGAGRSSGGGGGPGSPNTGYPGGPAGSSTGAGIGGINSGAGATEDGLGRGGLSGGIGSGSSGTGAAAGGSGAGSSGGGAGAGAGGGAGGAGGGAGGGK
jgi:hypothetical protein